MAYRLLESSSDVVVEAEGTDAAEALVELARAFSAITTAASPIASRVRYPVALEAEGSAEHLAVRFLDELVFLFATESFLPAGGSLRLDEPRPGVLRVAGELVGEAFDRGRHGLGTEVKAATLHEARFEPRARPARLRLLLDL